MASVRECKDMIRSMLDGAHDPGGPLTLMMWGPPGIGKTALVAQAARDIGLGFRSVISHLYQPVDVLGLPYIVDGRCEYAPPGAFPDAARDGERGVFFLDELPNCVPAMQSAWGIVVLERSTKHFKFPPGWLIVCAGNREGDRAGASRLVSALENRLCHVQVEPSRDEFLAYAVSRGLHPTVPAFLQERPDMMLKFDPKSTERAFASPRSWERVSDVMKLRLPEPARVEMLKGCVGAGTAVEFSAFIRVFDELPKLEDILAGRVDLRAFTRPDLLRAMVYSVLAWVGEQPKDRMNTGATVALGLSDEWAMLLVTRLYELDRAGFVRTEAWPKISARLGRFLT
ncbi:MAG: hypothetical protein Q8Q09_04410 [Deltaproteobacteria bacterium]|nr:hypothetical protein [Deltaproteobacteria bacterium]